MVNQPSSFGGSLRDHHMEQLEIPLELTDPNIYDSALGRAIAQWRTGRPIPLTLATELINQGYDLPSLERHYLN